MAINKIVAPLATAPNVFAAPVINHLNAHAINVNPIIKIANGYVKKGAMFCIGGELFAADADTAILGSNAGAIAVRFDVSGTTATATYVDDDTGVTWNGAYHGWYDTTNRYYERLWKSETGSPSSWVQAIGYYNALNSKIPECFYDARTAILPSSVSNVYWVERYYKPNITGKVLIHLSLLATSSYNYIVQKFNGSTYTTIYENNNGSVTGDPFIFIDIDDRFYFKVQNTGGYALNLESFGFVGISPDRLRK